VLGARRNLAARASAFKCRRGEPDANCEDLEADVAVGALVRADIRSSLHSRAYLE
jgi:hypothetical protein